MKRSPWFNARRQPPVNGGPDAIYETRCWYRYNVALRLSKSQIIRYGHSCGSCEWRGVLREGKK